jgi:hypothetical protein
VGLGNMAPPLSWVLLIYKGLWLDIYKYLHDRKSRKADEVSGMKTSRLLKAGSSCLEILKDLSAAFDGCQGQV